MASKYAGIVQDELRDLRGNAMQGAVVIVRNVGTTTPATVYNNPVLIASTAGGDSLINDAVTGLPAAAGLLLPGVDANGNYTFYADADVSYDLRVVWQGNTFDYRVRPKVVDEAYTSTADLTAALSGTYVGVVAAATGVAATDTATINAALAAGGSVTLPPTGNYVVTDLLINNATGLKFRSLGATITLSGTASLAYRGVEIRGTCTDIEVSGLDITCDGVVANKHAGIWSSSSATLTNVDIDRNVVRDPVVGIYMDVLSTGVLTDIHVTKNRILSPTGTASGQGYGIAMSGVRGGGVLNNTIVAAQRHSIYISAPPVGSVAGTPNPNAFPVTGNVIINHRIGLAPDNKSALTIARTQNVVATDNFIFAPNDVAIGVLQDGAFDVWNITVSKNHIMLPTAGGTVIALGGQTAPTAPANQYDVNCEGNVVIIDGVNMNGIRIFGGNRVGVRNNNVTILNAVATNACIVIDAVGGGVNNDYVVENNTLTVTDGAGGALGIRLTAGFATSNVKLRLKDNTITAPAQTRLFSVDAAITNVSVTVVGHSDTSGLTFSAGIFAATYRSKSPIRSDREMVAGTDFRASTGAGILATSKFLPGVVNQWHSGESLASGNRTTGTTHEAVVVAPLFSGPDGITISKLSVNVATAIASAVLRAGLWTIDDQTDPFAFTAAVQWATLLRDVGVSDSTFDLSTTGGKVITLATPLVIPANTWFAIGGATQGASGANCTIGNSGAGVFTPWGLVTPDLGVNASSNIGLRQNSVAGAFGNFTPGGAVNVGHGVALFRSA